MLTTRFGQRLTALRRLPATVDAWPWVVCRMEDGGEVGINRCELRAPGGMREVDEVIDALPVENSERTREEPTT